MVSMVVVAVLAQPFVRTHTSDAADAPCLWWAGPIEFRQNASGNPATGASAFTAVSAAFMSWNDAMQCSMMNVFEGARTATRRTGASVTGANINLTIFRTRSCARTAPSTHACWREGTCANTFDCWDQASALLGVTTVSYDTDSGRIFDADIEFNAADHIFSTVDAPVCEPGAVSTRCVASDIQNTATHEAGHLLGLGHTAANNSVMNDRSSMGERSKRSIDTGTRTFLCEAYDPTLGPDDCVTPPVPAALGPAVPSQGCSTSGLMLSPVLALTFLLRRRRLLSLVVLGLAPSFALATTVRVLELPALIDDSAVIVKARVVSSTSRWTDDGDRIVTEVRLSVSERWKGLAQNELVVLVPGGVVGRVGQHVEGAPRLTVGADYVLFLEARGPVFVPTGFHQGVFQLDGPVARQQTSHGLRLDWRGNTVEQPSMTLSLSSLRWSVTDRLLRYGADSNRALPLALPTQISR